jgi:hypothetical protein
MDAGATAVLAERYFPDNPGKKQRIRHRFASDTQKDSVHI